MRQRRRATTGRRKRLRFSFDGWTLDTASRQLSHGKSDPCELTTGEFNLLELFVRRAQRVLTRDEIMDVLKGHDCSALDRSVDALIVRLRKKVEPVPGRPQYIKSVRGVGYIFAANVQSV